MKNTLPKYKMSNIRNCISMAGDTTLSKWHEKRLAPGQLYKKGIRSIIRYSALEVVHVGVVALLSNWGVLNYYQDAMVFGGYVSYEHSLMFTPEELSRFTPDYGNFQVCELSLTEPGKIVDYYLTHGPNLNMVITSYQVPVEQEDRRMRRTKSVFSIRILDPIQTLEWEKDRLGLRPVMQELFAIGLPTLPASTDGADTYMEFGYLKLDIKRIISHVYEKLNISHLLD